MGEGLVKGIDVKTDALVEFSNRLMGYATQRPSDLMNVATDVGSAKLGGSGLPSGIACQNYHLAVVEQLNGLIADVSKGLMALSVGALDVSITYITSDESSAGAVQGVQNAFTPPPGQAYDDGPPPKGVDKQAPVTPVGLPTPTQTNPANSTTTAGTTNQQTRSQKHKSELDGYLDDATSKESQGYPKQPSSDPAPSPTPTPSAGPTPTAPPSAPSAPATPSPALPGPSPSTPTPTPSPGG